MASGEAEPLQYTTTVLRVSIHCEGCKKKVKKVLHNIEGVYKVTVDAAQHKVTVTGSVDADALIRRLHKAGKQAALWPVPAPAPAAKKVEEVAAAPPAAGEGFKKEVADEADAKPKEAAKEKGSGKQPGAESAEKKPENDKGWDKKPEKAEAAKKEDAKNDGEVAEPKEKDSPEPDKEAAAEGAAGEEASGKKGKKKKNKQKDGGEGEATPDKPPQPSMPAPAPEPAWGPERPHGAFPYYAPQPVMSYNVAHPSASVSYYAPTPVVPMQPMPMAPPPPQMPYGYSQYPPMMAPPPEFLYGPPGMRSSPPQESYNMFNEENANSCSLM
ncbi:heavy metal-associated isoprenylated plant protein 35-like [Phragmites australis]|uniref:heavy metal-associated isoprenylated plant protein 35-like n=1 Tax=Phragmites australis TaxID=29695 RepID=UPI002D76D274|nr:heavy metal-associated isoprenylated plant protein 35-like [Phragmites australis]